MKLRRVLLVLLCVLGTLGLVGAAGGTAKAAAPLVVPDVNNVPGLTFVSETQLDSRLYELTLDSTALVGPTNPIFGTNPNGQTKVRILLPDGYANSTQRYPVLYLFHGGAGNYTDWTTQGNAEAATAGVPAIVVMPDAGITGLCTNWFNFGAFGTPEWATYHNDQLVPWIDANYRTIADRTHRATAGLSMGGGCATNYAARYPELYGATGSFSGAVDYNNATAQGLLTPVTGFIAGPYYDTSTNPPSNEQVRWRGFNAWDLAANLVNTDVSLFTGNGQAGGPNGNSESPTEMFIHQMNVGFDQRLTQFNIPHYFDDYGPGDHSWYYWQRDLVQWLPHLMAYFNGHQYPTFNGNQTVVSAGHDSNTPRSFIYTSIDPNYAQYNWSVTIDRPALEFSALEVDQPRQFSVIGSGTATVVTAGAFTPGHTYNVTSTTSSGQTTMQSVIADTDGRLTIPLTLGPGNPYQQYSPQADQAGVGATPPPGAITNLPFYTEGNGSFFYQTTVAIG
jgi:S-formylglutathione hydrolase FrmB